MCLTGGGGVGIGIVRKYGNSGRGKLTLVGRLVLNYYMFKWNYQYFCKSRFFNKNYEKWKNCHGSIFYHGSNGVGSNLQAMWVTSWSTFLHHVYLNLSIITTNYSSGINVSFFHDILSYGRDILSYGRWHE